MPPVATTPRRMEAMASALERAGAQALIPKARADQLHMAFTATDAQGRSWTIGRESSRWCRLENEKWLASDPPAELFMDSELRSNLEAIEALASGTSASAELATEAPASPPPATETAPIVSTLAASPPPAMETVGGDAPAPMPATEFIAPLLATGIPEAHQRFAGPVAGPVTDPVTEPAPRAAQPASPADPAPAARALAPPSIAPTLRAAPIEARDDRAHIVLCVVLAVGFAVLGFWKADARGFAGAALFGVVSVTLTLVNLAQSRHD